MRSRIIVITTTLGAILGFPILAMSQEQISPLRAPIPSKVGKEFTEPPKIPSLPEELNMIDPATAPAESTYGLEELLRLASSNNPTLRQAQLQISGELGKALQAGLYPNPILSYKGEQIFLNVNGNKNSPGEFQGGVLQQRFVTAGKLRLSRQKYLRRAEVAEHRAMVQQFRVCNDVRIHFYRALAAGEMLAIKRELLKTAEDSAVTAQESYNMGQVRRPEVRRANISLQRSRLDLMKAENAYREEFRRLTALIGAPLREGMLRGDLLPQCDPLSFEQALDRLLIESPELAAARASLLLAFFSLFFALKRQHRQKVSQWAVAIRVDLINVYKSLPNTITAIWLE